MRSYTYLSCTVAALAVMAFAIPAKAFTIQIPVQEKEQTAAEEPQAGAVKPPETAAENPDTPDSIEKKEAGETKESATVAEPSKATPAAAPKVTDKVFDAKSFTLDNGMQVIVVENNRVPVVTQMVWYRVGAADEPRAKSGIAHFMEHLMFKGSKGLEPGEFSKIIRNLGGQDNAFTSQDYTAYFQSIAAEHLEKIMTMEAGRMRSMNPPEKEVISERQVILEERSQRTDNDPQAQFGETVNAALFVNHPYGIPVIGWAHEMETLSWDDAKTFYDHWYAPNNAILVISGDVKADEVYNLAKKIYGPLQKVDVPERARSVSPPLVGKNVLSYTHPTIRQPVYQRIYRVPSFRQNKNEALALQVLEDIFGSGSTSRLYKSLVIDQKLATGAGLNYSSSSWDDASLSVYASPAPGVTMEQIEAAMDEEIAKLVLEGISNAELSDSITRMQAEAIYARDSLTGPAMVLGYSLITGSTLDDVEYWPRDIGMVSADDVKAAAAKYIDTSASDVRYVTGYLLPPAPQKEADAAPAGEPSETEAQP